MSRAETDKATIAMAITVRTSIDSIPWLSPNGWQPTHMIQGILRKEFA